ncbi:alpha/beta hydrolase [Gordonia rubripertincta]|uniref:Alpha/beta hydrolase n=1 Tax=Gordonia rubripertincta TaxID=36822 RepID=A0ABT4MN02_GORRU|nr:alpha/beta hydrolase [Gordonia rubripertincta]MCZ4548372.1 alpha/beta hydrolase [Gordonia rubripertincta]
MTALDPQVAQLLNDLAARPRAQPGDVSIAAYRQAGESLVALAGPLNKHCAVDDIIIPVREGSVAGRRYRPSGSTTQRLPGVMYTHGGGFVRGSLDSHDRLCRELCVQGGLIVVSVAYHLAPENQFPRAHNDALDTFAWLTEHAIELGIDADSLAVAGDSSGASLAVAVANARRSQGAPVKAQGLLCPALDATMGSDSIERYGEGPFLTRKALQWSYDLYVPNAGDRQSPLASPVLARSLEGSPPAIIISAQVDPVADDARRYSAKLTAAGVSVHSEEYPGMPHSFVLLAGVLDKGEHAIASFASGLAGLLR